MSAKKEQAHISSYTRKLRDNVKAILENYGEILKAAKVGFQCCVSVNGNIFDGLFMLLGVRRRATESV